MSFERLHLIGRQSNSVLYKGNVYPSVKYLVRPGDEAQCEQELSFLFGSLKDFTDIHVVVTLLIERPFPRLESLLAFLRKQPLVRFVVLSLQRAPSELLRQMEARLGPDQDASDASERLRRIGAQLQQHQQDNAVNSPLASSESVDPYELLQLVEQATSGSIGVNDFVPISVAMLLEPLLPVLGYGRFRLRASPFCGFVCGLVNTSSHESVPLTRLYDVGALWRELSPLVHKEAGLGWFGAARVKRALKSAELVPGLPDLTSYLTDRDKTDARNATIRAMQFVVLHNNMDLAAVDMLRRCDCMNAASTIVTPSGLAAACTGCI